MEKLWDRCVALEVSRSYGVTVEQLFWEQLVEEVLKTLAEVTGDLEEEVHKNVELLCSFRASVLELWQYCQKNKQRK